MSELTATKQHTLPLIHGALAFPAFLPDATLGVVRGDRCGRSAAGRRARAGDECVSPDAEARLVHDPARSAGCIRCPAGMGRS